MPEEYLQVRIDPDVKDMLRELAAMNERDMTKQVIHLIKTAWQEAHQQPAEVPARAPQDAYIYNAPVLTEIHIPPVEQE